MHPVKKQPSLNIKKLSQNHEFSLTKLTKDLESERVEMSKEEEDKNDLFVYPTFQEMSNGYTLHLIS